MHAFYTRLAHFLVTTGLEDATTLDGCSEAEIVVQEQTYGVSFPLAYRLFLEGWGRTTPQSLGQDFRLAFLDYYWDSAHDLLVENKAAFEPGAFVFSERQGYSFYYFLLGSDNPPVTLCVIKSETEPGLDYMAYGRFTDWLINQIKEMAAYRLSIRKINRDLAAVWAELDQIAQLADHV